jgi:hypothetical protein
MSHHSRAVVISLQCCHITNSETLLHIKCLQYCKISSHHIPTDTTLNLTHNDQPFHLSSCIILPDLVKMIYVFCDLISPVLHDLRRTVLVLCSPHRFTADFQPRSLLMGGVSRILQTDLNPPQHLPQHHSSTRTRLSSSTEDANQTRSIEVRLSQQWICYLYHTRFAFRTPDSPSSDDNALDTEEISEG